MWARHRKKHSVIGQAAIQFCQGTGFNNVRHRLGLATKTQIRVCKSPFPSAGTAVSLFCAKTDVWLCVLENCVCIRLHHSRYPADSPAYRCDNSVHLHLGALVSARYTRDDIWYRARIIAVYQNKGLLFRCSLQILWIMLIRDIRILRAWIANSAQHFNPFFLL